MFVSMRISFSAHINVRTGAIWTVLITRTLSEPEPDPEAPLPLYESDDATEAAAPPPPPVCCAFELEKLIFFIHNISKSLYLFMRIV
jgi:hypothetical protein